MYYVSDRPLNAPRCFGLGSMFNADPAICGVCISHDACKPVAKISLARTTEIIGKNNIARMHLSVKVAESKVIVEGIKLNIDPSDKKVATLVNQMTRDNPLVSDYINDGKNPFGVSSKPPYLRLLIDQYLADNTDKALVEFMVDKFGKKQKDAEKTVEIVKEALNALGCRRTP